MSVKKIVFIVLGLLILTGVVFGTIRHNAASVTAVSTTKVAREDLLSVVSGTGQIKPKTYVNIGATAFGRITHLYVKEGDHVKKGATLATLENVQPTSIVAAQDATIASSKTDVNSMVAAEETAEANITEAKADLVQKKADYDRALALYNDKLIARQGLRLQEGRLRRLGRNPRPTPGRPRSVPRPDRVPARQGEPGRRQPAFQL